jgi:hypothetical protein
MPFPTKGYMKLNSGSSLTMVSRAPSTTYCYYGKNLNTNQDMIYDGTTASSSSGCSSASDQNQNLHSQTDHSSVNNQYYSKSLANNSYVNDSNLVGGEIKNNDDGEYTEIKNECKINKPSMYVNNTGLIKPMKNGNYSANYRPILKTSASNTNYNYNGESLKKQIKKSNTNTNTINNINDNNNNDNNNNNNNSSTFKTSKINYV